MDLNKLIEKFPDLTPDDADYLNQNQTTFEFEITSAGNPDHPFAIGNYLSSLNALTSTEGDTYVESCNAGNPNAGRLVRKS